jgi:hypothetical protein
MQFLFENIDAYLHYLCKEYTSKHNNAHQCNQIHTTGFWTPFFWCSDPQKHSGALSQMMAVYDQHDYMNERRAALDQLAGKILRLAKTDDAELKKMDREDMSSSAPAAD